MITIIKEYFETALAALDGVYGWFYEATAVLALLLFFNVFLHYFFQFLHKKFRKNHKHWQDSLIMAIDKPLCIYVWTIAGTNIFQLIVKELFGKNLLSAETMHSIIIFGGIFALAWFLMLWKSFIVKLMIEKSKTHEIVLEQNKIDLIGKLITLVIIFLTVLLILEMTGRNLNTLIAFGGIGGLAIAFASQEVIANFFSGFMIYITRPFAIDDWISLPERNIEGYVEEIGWYMTRIRTFEKRPIYIPNSTFSRIVVVNPSRMSHRQFKETISVRYKDLGRIKSIITDIKQMLIQHPEVDRSQRIIVNFTNYNSSSLDILIDAYLFTISSDVFLQVKQEILLTIAEILEKNGAKFSYSADFFDISLMTKKLKKQKIEA